MKVFLAGETALSRRSDLAARMKLFMPCRLFSYHYHGLKTGGLTDDVQQTIDLGAELFLDSGAFSAFQQGGEIPLPRYANFIHEHGHHFSVKANIDVIGDAGPKSWANLKELEARGAGVFPVFHFTDDDKWLVKILDEGYDFFALGGLVGAGRKVLMAWLDRVWTRYLTLPDGSPRCKVHGFGLTDQVLMLRYPWYSVDSASWVFSASFGSCVFAVDGKLRSVTFSKDSPDQKVLDGWCYDNLPPRQQAVVRGWLEGSGCTVEECGQDYLARFIVNARAYTELGQYGKATWRPEQETFF